MAKKQKKIFIIEGVTRNEVVRSLADTRFNSLRTRKSRRVLVVALSTLLTLEVAASWLPKTPAMIVGDIGFFLILFGYFAIRSSVRHVADSPDELLDERQIRVRDRSYLHAYRIMAGAFALVLLAISSRSYSSGARSGEGWVSLWNLWMAVFLLMAALPSMVIAWTDSGEES
jgi:uncharacterized membrane protein